MTFAEIGDMLLQNKGYVAVILVVVLSSIEISPLKLNPWTYLRNGLRHIIGITDVNKKIDTLDNKIENLEDRYNEGQAIQARVRILRFGDELSQHEPIRHSKDSYEQVLDDITRYEKYCNTHPEFQNNMTVITSQVIKDTYEKCMREGGFL